MSAFLDLLRRRRSTRRFLDRPVSPQHRALLEEALLRSPSSRDLEPWTFVLVEDPATREALASCKPHGAAFVAQAPLAVVVAGDESTSDVWIEDCSIATILVQLAAEDLGLGSCWVQVRRRHHAGGGSAEAAVRQAVGLPDELRVLSIVAVGHPARRRSGRPGGDLRRARIHRERYQGREPTGEGP